MDKPWYQNISKFKIPRVLVRRVKYFVGDRDPAHAMPAILDADGITAHAVDALERSRRMREIFSTRTSPAQRSVALDEVVISASSREWEEEDPHASQTMQMPPASTPEERIAALESIVAQQSGSLQQATQMIWQMRDELLRSDDLVRGLRAKVGSHHARLQELERGNVAKRQPCIIEEPDSVKISPGKIANGREECMALAVRDNATENCHGDSPASRDDNTPASSSTKGDKVSSRDTVAKLSYSNRFVAKSDPRSAAKNHAQHLDVTDSSEYQWSQLNENAYGAFIHTALTQGLSKALARCLLALAVSFCVQGVFSIELYLSLPDIYETTHHLCTIPSDLQLSAVFVFLILMLNNAPDMWKAMKIASFAQFSKRKTHLCTSEDQRPEKDMRANEVRSKSAYFVQTGVTIQRIEFTKIERLIIALLGCGTEVISWSLLLATGVKFIMTATNVEMVMRSTVSIVFVLQVDELLYAVCCPKVLKASLKDTTYRVFHSKAKVFAGRTSIATAREKSAHLFDKIDLYVHLPLLLALTASIVFGIRRDPRVTCTAQFTHSSKNESFSI